MKAIVFTSYGSPDVLALQEIDRPTPKDDEILVKVHAASANPLDWHRMRGAPFLARLSEGYLRPKVPLLGADLAGTVESVGSSVTEFKPGDEVFGIVAAGSFAEYVCVPEKALTLKPANISFEEAAGAPVVGFTAVQGLRDSGKIQSGQKVLVNGASGGVGTYAVQIAKAYGAEVTGVCSTRNLEMVRSIGADHVIDYTNEDFTRSGQQYDLIYEAVGNRTVGDLKRALAPDGICTVVGFTSMSRIFQVIFIGAWVSRRGSQKIGLMGTAQANKKDLEIIRDYLQSGAVTTVIDKTYPLSQAAEAMHYLETGHARGKVIVSVTA